MRKDYLEPVFDIVYFSNEDVILASGETTTKRPRPSSGGGIGWNPDESGIY